MANDNTIRYKLNGKNYDVPADRSEQFEKQYPEATQRFKDGEDEYDIAIADRDRFKSLKPAAVLSFGQAPEVKQPQAVRDTSIPTNVPVDTSETVNRQLPDSEAAGNSTDSIGNYEKEQYDGFSESSQSEQRRLQELLDKRSSELSKGGKAAGLRINIMNPALSIATKPTDGDAESNMIKSAQSLYRQADRTMEAGRNGSGFGKGLADSFTKETWDMGIQDLSNNINLIKAAKKEANGETLTDGELALLDAAAHKSAVDLYYGDVLTRGYKTGLSVGQSLPFMLEFLLNPASSGANGSVSLLSRAMAKRLAKKAIGEEAVEAALKKGGVKALSEAVKKETGKALATGLKKAALSTTKVADDIAASAIMTGTTGLAGMTADALGRKTGEVMFKETPDGYIYDGVAGGDDTYFGAFAKAYGARTIENFSEMLGNYFAPIGRGLASGGEKFLKKIGLDKFNDLVKNVGAADWVKTLNHFLQHTRWDGVSGEFGEEIVGGVLNALTVGDQTIGEVFDADNMIDTFLAVGAMGGFFSAIKTVGYRTPTQQVKDFAKSKEKALSDVFEDGEEQSIVFDANLFDEEGLKQYVQRVRNDESYTAEQKKAILDYVFAKEVERGMLMGKAKKEEEEPQAAELDDVYESARETLDPEAKRAAKLELDNAMSALTEDEIRFLDDDSTRDFQMEANPEKEQQYNRYLKARAAMQGINDSYEDMMAQEIERSNNQIDSQTASDGMWTELTNSNGEVFHVVSGNVAVNGDNTINHNLSDGRLIVQDANGKKSMATSRDFSSGRKSDAQMLKEAASQEVVRRYEALINSEINTPTKQEIADSIGVDEVFNTPVGPAEGVAANITADGNVIVRFNEPVSFDGVNKPKAVHVFSTQDFLAMRVPTVQPTAQRVEQEAAPAGEANQGNSNNEAVSPAPSAQEEKPLEQKVQPSEPVEVDYRGQKIPMKAGKDGSTVVDQQKFFDNDAEAWAVWNDAKRNDQGESTNTMLNAQIKKLEGEKVKLDRELNRTTDFDRQGEILDRINEIDNRVEELRDIADRRGKRASLDAFDAVNPETPYKYIAYQLAGFKGQVDEESYRKETGYKGGEIKHMRALLAKKNGQKGKSLPRIAEIIKERDGEGFTASMDEQEVLNAVLDILSEVSTWSELNNYVKSSKIARKNEMELQALRAEENAEREAEGMTEEEIRDALAAEQTEKEQLNNEIAQNQEGYEKLLANEMKEGAEQSKTEIQGLEGMTEEDMPSDIADEIEAARQEVDTDPTEAQKKAGNYKMGHVKVDGYEITIENPKDSVRKGNDANGKEWQTEMKNDYGYIRGTEGPDGDHIDVFLSETPEQGDVFVVDQVNPDGSFDEHKVMYGFSSVEEARAAYLANYEEGWQGLGNITPVSKEEFKKWVESSHRKTKPFAEYASVKPLQTESEEKNSGPDNTMDTGETPEGKRNDTATPQNAVSENKDSEISETAKEAESNNAENEQIKSKAPERFGQIKKKAAKMSEKLNTPIVVHDDVSSISEQDAVDAINNGEVVYGWFNIKDNSVHLYAPTLNEAKNSLKEVEKTVFHEVVGHHGLKQLLGQEKFDELCDKVWDSMDPLEQAFGLSDVSYMKNADIKTKQRAAADEYMARIAETVEYEKEKTIWDIILEKIKELFGKLESTDVEIVDALRESYKMLAKSTFENTVASDIEATEVDNATAYIERGEDKRDANPQIVISHAKEKYDDFGEKIGMARKDTAKRGFKRGEGGDSAPTWRKKYKVANIRPMTDVEKRVASASIGLRYNIDFVPEDGVDFDESKPFVGFYEETVKSRFYGDRVRRHYIKDENGIPIKFDSMTQFESTVPVFEAKVQKYYVTEGDGKYKIARRASNGKSVEYAVFDSEEEARAYLASPEGCISLLNHKRDNFELPALEELTRNNAKDWRKGKDVTPDDFLEMFGFRGGEFGNWLNADERQQFLNYAYDALMDLSSIIGVSPRALSLNGELSIAFGARGVQGAKAHYEPRRAVINLTKMNGAGSLAHEWAHALDNYFGLRTMKKTRDRENANVNNDWYITEDKTYGLGARQEVRSAFSQIMNTIKRKEVTRAIEVDKSQEEFDELNARVDKAYKEYRDRLKRGITKWVYNRKTKQREQQKIDLGDGKLQEIDALVEHLKTDPTFAFNYDTKKSGFRGEGEVAAKIYELIAPVMPNRSETYGPMNDVFYWAKRLKDAGLRLEKAKNGETETVKTKTRFLEQSEWFDKGRASSYFSKDVELFARAFETYVMDKMRKQGVTSDYLTYDKGSLYEEMWLKNPYPSREELEAVSEKFDNLFSTLQESEDENGNVSLFRKYIKDINSAAERKYRKDGSFSFTGKEKVNNVDDVAFIFRELENSATENAFIVFVKDQKPTILHVGMGNISSVIFDHLQMVSGYNDFQPDEIYMVHNHPSGNVMPSLADIKEFELIEKQYPNVLCSAIIIDTKSGKYGLFDKNSHMSFDMKENDEKAVEIPTLSFDRMVFNKDFKADEFGPVSTPEKVAAFLSAYRLGEGNKMGALLLNRANVVNGNLITEVSRLDEENSEELAEQIADACVRCNASGVILFGNFTYNTKGLSSFRKRLVDVSGDLISLLDGVTVKNDKVYSIYDENFLPDNNTRFRKANMTQNGFISNAAASVERIKMEKATPAQWKAMLTKEGGMKAAEDKWLGLSDWLDASQAKTLTKDEVMNFINENAIQIEEKRYSEAPNDTSNIEGLDRLTDEYNEFLSKAPEGEDPEDYAYNKMEEKYDGDFWINFALNNGKIEIQWDSFEYFDIEPAMARYGVSFNGNVINNTRLDYTTDGLVNKREIALTVPTIEPWNESDEVHFGDAGNGRAVAWIRFGGTSANRPLTVAEKRVMMDKIGDVETWRKLDGSNFVNKHDLYIPYDVAHTSTHIADYGEKGFLLTVRDKSVGLFPTKEEAAQEYARIREEEIGRKSTYDKVLFIDEIQSKRHQEGREKGYSESLDNATVGKFYEEAKYGYDMADVTARNGKVIAHIYKTKDGKYYGESLDGSQMTSDRDTITEVIKGLKSFAEFNGIPAAPFEKNWQELAMKRMLRLAAEEGYDKVAWTTGETQAERYELGKKVENILISENRESKSLRNAILNFTNGDSIFLSYNEKGDVRQATDSRGVPIEEMRDKNLAEVVGKETAGKLIDSEIDDIIQVEGLNFGGEGMKGFYDKILVDFMNKYGKKWGVKVEDVELDKIDQMAHTVTVTPEMRQSVMEGQTMFRIREKEAPKQTGIGYKVFVLKNGLLYPPMVANPDGASTPVGVWLDADAVPVSGLSKTGRPQVKAGGKGTQGGSGQLAYRPGWHLGTIPYAIQFNRKDVDGEKTLFPKDFVWAEVEYAADKNYQKEAEAEGMTENGKYRHSYAGLKEVPEDGFYTYRTNPNPETDPWIITGAMRVKKILTPSEVDELVRQAGREPQKREEGSITDEQVGVLNESLNTDVLEELDGDIRFSREPNESDKAIAFVTGRTPEEVANERVEKTSAIRSGLNELIEKYGSIARVAFYDEKGKGAGAYYDGVIDIYSAPINEDASELENTYFHENFHAYMDNGTDNSAFYNELIEATRKESEKKGKKEEFDNFVSDIFNDEEYSGYKEEEVSCRIVAGLMVAGNISGIFPHMSEESRDILRNFLNKLYYDPDREQRKRRPLRDVDGGNGQILQEGENLQMRRGAEDEASAIRYRKGEDYEGLAFRDRYERILGESAYKIREAHQDSMLSLKVFQDELIKESGLPIEEYEDAYTAENHLSSINGAEVEAFIRNEYAQMGAAIADMNKAGVDNDDCRKYVVAKHGLERNEAFARRDAHKELAKDWEDFHKKYSGESLADIDQDKYDEEKKKLTEAEDALYEQNRQKDYSGLTSLFLEGEEKEISVSEAERRAEAFINEIEDKAGKQCVNLWTKINNATKKSLYRTYKGGLMTRSAYESVRDMFNFYVPLRGFDDTMAEDVYEYLSPSSPFSPSLTRTAKGRVSVAFDPFATIGNMYDSSVHQANKNRMKEKFLNFVLNRPNDLVTVKNIWYQYDEVNGEWVQAAPKIDNTMSPEQISAAYEAFESRMRGLAAQGKAMQKKPREAGVNIPYRILPKQENEHYVTVTSGGKEYILVVNGNPRLAQALNGMTNPHADDILGKIANSNRWLSANYTTRSPKFILRNMTRDTLFSLFAIDVKEDGAYNRAFRGNLVKNYGRIWQLMNDFKSGKLEDMDEADMSEAQKYFKEFIMNGGETGYSQIRRADEYKKMYERMIAEYGGGNKNEKLHVLKEGWRGVDSMVGFANRCVEDICRFSVYMTSRQMGRDISASVSNAKDVSVNFNKKGSGKGKGAGLARASYLFYNAGVQGLENFTSLRGKSNKHWSGLKKFDVRIAEMLTLGAMIPVINSIISSAVGGDDDEYCDLPDWVRRNNLCLGGGGFYVTLPLPIELRAIYGIGDIFYMTAAGRMKDHTPAQIALETMGQIADILPLNPVEGAVANKGDDLRTGIILSLTPDLAAPVAQMLANTDFTGKPIWRENSGNTNRPEWTKAYAGTSKALVSSAKFLNAITGGDEYEPGAININPAAVEHLLESYFGGMLQFANESAKTVRMTWDEDVRKLRNVPLVNVFTQYNDNKTASSYVNDMFYHYKKESETTLTRLRGVTNEGDIIRAADVLASPEYQRAIYFRDESKKLKKLQDKLEEAEGTPAEEIIQSMIKERKEMMVEWLTEND